MTKYSCFRSSCVLALIALLFLNSCAPRVKNALFQGANDIDPSTVKDIYVVNDQGLSDINYKIKINDMISVRNVQNTKFGASGGVTSAIAAEAPTFQVDNNGTVNLPSLGKVLLAGLTRREARIKLQELFEAPDKLTDPIIELTITNLKVTLFGEFASAGELPLERDNVSLMEIIGKAGGFTKNADLRTLKIIRGDKKNPEFIYVNLTNKSVIGHPKLILQNNDFIIIEPTKSVMAAERLQSYNNIIQPLLVIVNLAVLIFTFTR